jgi:hypothetical protein
MPWWRRSQDGRNNDAGRTNTSREQAGGLDGFAEVEAATINPPVPSGRTGTHDLMPLLRAASVGPSPVTPNRLADALRRIDVYFLSDPASGNLVAMWERHAVMFALEGPDKDILMVRARAHGTVPADFADRAYPAVNAWNHDRRFLKAYLGEPTDTGRLPLYAEMQVPLVPGVHEALLDELLGCAVDVAEAWAEWLHTDGAVL